MRTEPRAGRCPRCCSAPLSSRSVRAGSSLYPPPPPRPATGPAHAHAHSHTVRPIAPPTEAPRRPAHHLTASPVAVGPSAHPGSSRPGGSHSSPTFAWCGNHLIPENDSKIMDVHRFPRSGGGGKLMPSANGRVDI